MKGFTLIELIIVIFIIMILGALSVPFFQSFQVSSELYTLTDEVTRTLRNARVSAAAGQNSSKWGVKFDDSNKKFTLYKGNDFNTRDLDYDLVFNYKTIFSISTDFTNDEINFDQYTALPSTQGTITLTSQNNQTHQITINSIGVIDASF